MMLRFWDTDPGATGSLIGDSLNWGVTGDAASVYRRALPQSSLPKSSQSPEAGHARATYDAETHITAAFCRLAACHPRR